MKVSWLINSVIKLINTSFNEILQCSSLSGHKISCIILNSLICVFDLGFAVIVEMQSILFLLTDEILEWFNVVLLNWVHVQLRNFIFNSVNEISCKICNFIQNIFVWGIARWIAWTVCQSDYCLRIQILACNIIYCLDCRVDHILLGVNEVIHFV